MFAENIVMVLRILIKRKHPLSKKIFILFLHLFLIVGQINKYDEMDAILASLNNVQYTPPIIYIKAIQQVSDSRSKQLYIKKIGNGVFYKYSPIDNNSAFDPETGEAIGYAKKLDSICLTKEERKILISAFGASCTWDTDLFPNSISVENEDEGFNIISMLKSGNNQKPDTGHFYVFLFSKPIYIRNNSVCLIAMSAICGGTCGITDISFYKKVNEKWEKWINVGGGVF